MTRLSPEDDISLFDCGSSEWEENVAAFLKEDALQQQQMGLNVTWLCRVDGDLVGFASLVASTLSLEKGPEWKARLGLGQIQRRFVPCMLVAQFGVARNAQRQGIGSFMLSWVRGAALESSMGIKLVTLQVDRGNDVGRRFWTSQRFINFPPGGGGSHLFMVYDLYS